MKLFNLLFISLLLPIHNDVVPDSLIYGHGVDEYISYPVDIDERVTISLPFTTLFNRTLVYEISVNNKDGVRVFKSEVVTKTLSANERFYIKYTAAPGATSLGQNRLRLDYKASDAKNDETHYCYFYGYQKGMYLDLNNIDQSIAAMNEETVYIYDGFLKETATFKKTSFAYLGLNSDVYYPTDVKLDLSHTYLYTSADYPASFYKEAMLFISDHTLFPYFPRKLRGAQINVKLIKEGYYIYIVPAQQFYIDPVTHIISPTFVSGFHLTNNIYFPRDRFNDIKGVTCHLIITEYGFHKFNLTFTFKIDVEKTFIGSEGYHEAVIVRS